jgi:hypothetical protein
MVEEFGSFQLDSVPEAGILSTSFLELVESLDTKVQPLKNRNIFWGVLGTGLLYKFYCFRV